MKVQFLTVSLGQSGGGVSLAMAELARELTLQDVTVSARAIEDGEPPVLSPLNFSTETHAVSNSWPWRQSRFLRQASRMERCDVIHTHGLWTDCSVAAEAAGRVNRTPIMISPHGMLDPWAVNNSRWKKKIASLLFESRHLKRAACLHALCAAEVAAIRSYGLTNPVAMIPNGVSLPQLEAKSKSASQLGSSPSLLFLGRLHRKKGLSELVEAWGKAIRQPHLPADRLRWHLAIAGWDQGGELPTLKAQCRENGIAFEEIDVASYLTRRNEVDCQSLQGQIFFLGPAFGQPKDHLLRQADAFILPSYSEGLPVAVLEAWSYGLPVVMSHACNLPVGFEMQAAIPITMFAGDRDLSVQAIQECIIGLMEASAADLQALGTAGRRLVERDFTWQHIASQMSEVYQWMVGDRRSPASISP